MPRQTTFRLSGANVVQTTEETDDQGVLERRSTIVLGDRPVVLSQTEDHLAEAQAEFDGLTAAAAESPIRDTGGTPGRSKVYHVTAGIAYGTEIDRDAAGNLRSARTRSLGIHSIALARATERRSEILATRNGIRDAV